MHYQPTRFERDFWMNKNMIETVLGAVVLLIAVMFLSFAYNAADLGKASGYTVSAEFDRVDGLSEGTDVRLSGIKIGSVSGQDLDPETYRASLELTIDKSIKLPVDTVAEVSTEGLLGGKYISLIPGSEEEYIEEDGQILFTTPPLDLVQLLGKFIFSDNKDKSAPTSSSPAAKATTEPAVE